jgi:hypothetical protein
MEESAYTAHLFILFDEGISLNNWENIQKNISHHNANVIKIINVSI